MDTFTASNGISVKFDGGLLFGASTHTTYVAASESQVQALREFFRAERDEELGRWRHPKKPEWVVYSLRPGYTSCNGADLLLIDEMAGSSMEYERALDDGTEYVGADERAARIARDYFDAHPERKPWEDAKHGEVWLIAIDGEAELPMVVDRETTSFPRFMEPIGAMSYGPRAGITDARRIYPEVSDAD